MTLMPRKNPNASESINHNLILGHEILELNRMRAALDSLPLDLREPIILLVQLGNYESTARVMGCTVDAVKTKVKRARDRLTILMSERKSLIQLKPDEVLNRLKSSRNNKQKIDLLGDQRPVNLASAADIFIKAFNAAKDSGKQEAILYRVLEQTGHAHLLPNSALETLPELPAQPPKLWLKHREMGETPPEFIARVYEDYIGKGLTRAFFLQPGQDKPLYNALAKWLRSNPMPENFDLPTRVEANTRRLEAVGPISAANAFGAAIREASPETRERVRLYKVAHSRAKRNPALQKS
jgi:hypothetical protein